MKFNKKETLFTLLAVFLVIAFLEFILSLLAIVSSQVEWLISSPYSSRVLIPRTVPDDRFGKMPNPKYPGHDSKGFRNLTLPTEADIVALGDSQTYGTGVDPRMHGQDNWSP